MSWLEPLQHWLAVHTGTVNESGPFYGFWSGFGSDLGEVTLLGALIVSARRANCHSHRCWRLARHPVEGTGYRVCGHHHRQLHGITGHVTFEHIREAHRRAKVPRRQRRSTEAPGPTP